MSSHQRIKVLEICGGLSTEGIGVFLLNTFENIDKEKFEVDFALATHGKQYYEDRIKNQRGKIYRTYEIGEGLKGKIKHLYKLYYLIKKEKYDVVHSHMDFFNGLNLMMAFFAGAPNRISHAHLANNNQVTLQKSIYYAIMKFMISLFSNKSLGCSYEANEFINGGGKVLINGINIEKFRDKSYSIPSDISFNNNMKNLITVGRIDEQKNPFYIIDIIFELTKITDDIHLYWIGTGSLFNEVKNKIKELEIEKNITLLGTRNDVEVFLSNMDVFLLPSKYEGFGIVLAEAQVAGLPCFISEHVPLNANLGLCDVISLDEGARVWAQKINNYFSNKNSSRYLSNLEMIDIKNTILQLQNEYKNK